MEAELFPIKKLDPKLAEFFQLANAGNYYLKQKFYMEMKPFILNNFAVPDGYDKQIVTHKCNSCNGTGIYTHYHYEHGEKYELYKEPCYNCENGIYSINYFKLKRYDLNGSIYHIPENYNKTTEYKNVIEGIIKHDDIDSNLALSAYLKLLWHFNKLEYYRTAKDYYVNALKSKKKLLPWFKEIFPGLFKDDLPF